MAMEQTESPTTTTTPRCIICEEDEPSPATAACTECRIYLCDFDALMHKGTPATRLHQLVRLKPLGSTPDTTPPSTTPPSPSHLPHTPIRGIGHYSDLTCNEGKDLATSPVPPLLPHHHHLPHHHDFFNTTIISEEEEDGNTPIDSDSSSMFTLLVMCLSHTRRRFFCCAPREFCRTIIFVW